MAHATTAAGTVVGVIPAVPQLTHNMHYPVQATLPQPAPVGAGVIAGTGIDMQMARPQRHPSTVPSEADDFELARRLQLQENEQASLRSASVHSSTHSVHSAVSFATYAQVRARMVVRVGGGG